MGLVSGIVVYTCLWWVLFFMALPFGVQQVTSVEQGHDPGAPKKPFLLIKFLITTVLAAIGWFAIDYLITIQAIKFSELP
jgi:predicted secreted protein